MRRITMRTVGIAALAGALIAGGLAATPAASEPVGPAQPQGSARVAAPGDPFACPSSRFFLSQGSPTQMSTLTPGSDEPTEIGAATRTYNAIGYNEADGFIYAILSNGHLGRIDGEGNVEDLGQLTDGNNATFNAGAVHSGGRYYFVTTNANSALYRIDLDDPNYADGIHTLRIPLFDEPGGNPRGALSADVTFLGDDLWGERSNSDQFARITLDDSPTGSPTFGVVDLFNAAPVGVVDSESGAAWTYANGNLGFSDNDTGDIYQVRVDNPTAATPTFTLVAVSEGPDSSVNDGTACRGGDVDLAITKTAAPSPVTPGGVITYTLTVENLSGTNDSSGFVVSDTVPADLTNLSTSSPGCDFAGQTLTCTGGALPAGDSVAFEYTADAPGATGSVVNAATVTGNERDPDADNNTSTITVPVATPAPTPTPTPTPTPSPAPGPGQPSARPDLVVRKTAPAQAQADRSVTWRIVVRNRGNAASVGAVLTDTLPKQVRSSRVATPKGVRCTVAKRNVRCELGTIAPGKKLVVKITGRLSPNAKGRMTNTARVTDAQDSNVRNNSSAATTRVRPVGAGTPCRVGVASTAVSPVGAPQVRTAGRAGC
ncbi:DUF11 domain-containing protein [Sporichthya polymorpha]|uniref:DUF11 domain-containing protein n=1 Tax=Sporichthya polymorpha TaxID=35751 RepID=UPI00038136D3|nr:DUF11 domain-containing protein [Sporichthya polymorpha]